MYIYIYINRSVIKQICTYTYTFIPQTSTTDAIMALKDFVQEGFSNGEITAIVSLDVEGASNFAWHQAC